MKSYYRNPLSSTKKSKVIIKVLIVAVCCITAFALTVIYGNHLLKKAEESAQNGMGGHVDPVTSDATSDDKKTEYAPKRDTEYEKLRHNCAFIDLSVTDGEADVFAQIDDAYGRGYDAVSIIIRDSEGTLYYASESLSGIFGIQFDSSLPNADRISEIVDYAKLKMMTVSAVFETCGFIDDKELSSYDELIVSELADAGLDEIVLTGIFEGESVTSADVENYLAYLTRLRANAPRTWFGVIVNSELYATAVYAPLIETLAKYTDILLVDLRPLLNEAEDKAAVISEFHNTLTGSITRYNLRVVTEIAGDDEKLKTAFDENALTNRTEIPYTLSRPNGD